MGDQSLIFDTIGRIYDTALSPGAWPEVLDMISACTGATSSVFMLSDKVIRELDTAIQSAQAAKRLWTGLNNPAS